MANPEHLAMLRRGVDAWNEWRSQNYYTQADLSRADLASADLRDADLHHVNLNRANLWGADLWHANLSGTYLIYTDLRYAKLWRADLSDACLIRAKLSHAELHGADLRDADLRGADLTSADAQYSQLCRCDLRKATLTGARLYATARDDWIIKGVECKYILWDAKGKTAFPEDRLFAPGEFEQIYKTLPTIEYIFQNGMTLMDLLIMDRVVEAIREQNAEYDLKIDQINARGLAPSVQFTVQQEEHKEPALGEVTRRYDTYIERLETDKHRLAALLAQALETNRLQTLLLAGAVERIGDNIRAEAGANVATRGAGIHIEYINNAIDLQKIIVRQPEDSPTFAKVAKKTALDLIGSALKDVAKGQAKEAAKQIYELGKDLGPVVFNTAAYTFFKSCLGR